MRLPSRGSDARGMTGEPTQMRNLSSYVWCGSAFAWPSAFFGASGPLRCLPRLAASSGIPAWRLAWMTQTGLGTRGRLDREKPGCPFRPHGIHLPAIFRTLRSPAGRRLPPARERLAKHSGDGSEVIVGTDFGDGDESGAKWLIGLREVCRVPPGSSGQARG
jgi:hypothetical protein